MNKRMEKVQKTFGVVAKQELDENSGLIQAYASVYDVLDRDFDVVARGAFAKSIPVFLSESGIALFNHDPNRPVGKVIDLVDDDLGLLATVQVASTSDAQSVYQLVRENVINKFSVWIRVNRSEKLSERELEELIPDWRERPASYRAMALGFGRRILEAELLELGPVSVPANPAASVVEVKSVNELAEASDDDSEITALQSWQEQEQELERIYEQIILLEAEQAIGEVIEDEAVVDTRGRV